jgi:hypothetical protein
MNARARKMSVRRTKTVLKLAIILCDNAYIVKRGRGYSRGSLGLGPGRRPWARYSSTALAVVTQLRPSLTPQISPRLTSRRRWPAERALNSAAARREINISRPGWLESLLRGLVFIVTR